MPGPSPYEQARARMAELRARNPRPPARTWMDSFKDYGGALKDSAVGTVEGINDMLGVMSGNTDTIARKSVDWANSAYDFGQKSNPDRAKALGIGGLETVTGLPISQVGDEIGRGEYAKAAGHATLPLIGAAFGARAMMRGRGATAGSVVEPPPPLTPPAPRPRLQLPGPGGTGPGATRFVAGDAGIADVTTPYRRHLGNPDPYLPEKMGGTPTLADIGEVVDVGPTVAAQGMGPHPLPPRSVGAQMTSAAAETRKGMLGKRARVPKKASKITKAERARLIATDEVEPVQMPGYDRRTLFKGKEDYAPQQTPQRYPSTDPGVVGDVEPVVDLSEVERLKNATARSPVKATTKPQHPRPGPTRLMENFKGNKAIEDTLAQSKSARPYEMISDGDLATLVKYGDKKAIAEVAARQNGGAPNPTKPSTAASRLANERGSVDFSAGVEKAKGQLKRAGKKTLGVVKDAQRAALLTGAAIPKSGLGALGGLVAEVAERAGTQSPKKTLGDLKTVAKSVPKGLKRGMRGLRGEDDLAEAQRHLSPPGPLSKPALRLMAMQDGPARQALEALGLSHEEALRRILNAKPASKMGKGLINYLRAHPNFKEIVAPVGATTSVNMLEQGLLRTPGINMLKNVKKMDPATMIKGRTAIRGLYGAGAIGAGAAISDELGEKNYLVKGLLAALAGPYGLPLGLGMAFANEKSLGDAIDNLGNTLGREAPFRIPEQKLSTEIQKRFTPAIVRQLTDPDAVSATTNKKKGRPARPKRPHRPRRN